MTASNLKIAIVAAALRYRDLATQANNYLTPELHLSELDISKLVTRRKRPLPEQAKAIARVLRRRCNNLFAEDASC